MTMVVAMGMWLINCEKEPEYIIIDGHEFVDLGLPSGLKWAKCNVGANNPEEYGNYYAWGETEPKSEYTSANYSFTYDEYFTIDSISGNPKYDVATNKWGSNCRMPSRKDFKELIDKCTWKLSTQNGVNGHNVIGPNGDSIFFPATGMYYQEQPFPTSRGGSGYYWSSTYQLFYADYLCTSSDVSVYEIDRHWGLTVRPVSD